MSTKSQQIQVRVTPEQKEALQAAAKRAGVGVSAYLLARALPPARLRLDALLQRVGEEEKRSFVMAELQDLLVGLSRVEWEQAVSEVSLDHLSPYLQNYVAAMIEQAASQKGVAAPAQLSEIEPLAAPHFATPLRSVRLHLLRSSPVPFRRRNLFVDSAIGDRV